MFQKFRSYFHYLKWYLISTVDMLQAYENMYVGLVSLSDMCPSLRRTDYNMWAISLKLLFSWTQKFHGNTTLILYCNCI